MKRALAAFLALIVLAISGCAAAQVTASDAESRLLIDRVFEAQSTLRDVVRETPLVEAPALSDDGQVYLKLENLQATGSFKLRGAYYAISKLSDEEKSRGIVTCSAGNHAQGVALAAEVFGIKATIFIPESAPEEKKSATRAYGVDVVVTGKDFAEAKAAAERFVSDTNGVYIPPYDDINVIAGQGTIAWEIVHQLESVEVVVVPVGGGGLISGIASVIKTLKPSCRVYGVETEGMNSMQLSLEAGMPVAVPYAATLADGIAVAAPSELTFSICKEYVDEIVTVTEDEIADAIVHLFKDQNVVAEGAGAVSVAAVLSNKIPLDGEKVVCVVSGGNIAHDVMMQLLDE